MRRRILLNFCKLILPVILGGVVSFVSFGQRAVVSNPLGIGRNCGGGGTTDSFRVLSYNDAIKTLAPIFKCKPNLVSTGIPKPPGFSSNAGSIAYNPYDQNVYYIATTTGNESFVYHWRPDTCHTTAPPQNYSNYYSNQFVVGLDFNPTVANEGFQFETKGTAPFETYLRKVDFSANYFGPSDTLVLPGGKKIYQQQGDIIFTPQGKLYIAFNNKLFQVDYSTYGQPSKKVYATFIDTLNFGSGYNLTGIAYAQGKFIGSTQKGSSPCAFKEIDISSGSAVISPVTLPANNFTATDMATMISGVGTSKKVYSVTSLPANQWTIQYDVSIRNFGNIKLINVQLLDSVAKTFGASFVSASAAAVGTLPSGITMNGSYNGQTNCNVFATGSWLGAIPADSAKVRITVNLNNPNLDTTYNNSAIGLGQGQLFATNVRDSSNNSPAMLIDPNGMGVPDGPNSNVPTPLLLRGWIVVPVSLLDFNARVRADRTVEVFWKISNDEPVAMEVQRSNDAINFSTITELESGTKTGMQGYSYLDRNPAMGLNYYRVRFVRNSGSSFFSEVVKINFDNNIKPVLKVGPVPFTGRINISLQLENKERISYKLLDFSGRIIYSEERNGIRGENNFVIDQLQKFHPGNYVLQVNANGQLYNKMIMKISR